MCNGLASQSSRKQGGEEVQLLTGLNWSLHHLTENMSAWLQHQSMVETQQSFVALALILFGSSFSLVWVCF